LFLNQFLLPNGKLLEDFVVVVQIVAEKLGSTYSPWPQEDQLLVLSLVELLASKEAAQAALSAGILDQLPLDLYVAQVANVLDGYEAIHIILVLVKVYQTH